MVIVIQRKIIWKAIFILILLTSFSCIYFYYYEKSSIKIFEEEIEKCENLSYVGGEYDFYYNLDDPNEIYIKKYNETKFIKI